MYIGDDNVPNSDVKQRIKDKREEKETKEKRQKETQ